MDPKPSTEPKVEVKSPGLISGIYRKVSLSLGRNRGDSISKSKTGADGTDVVDTPTRDGDEETDTPTRSPLRKERADSESTIAPTITIVDDTTSKSPGSRETARGHIRSISQQVDVESYKKDANGSPTLSEPVDNGSEKSVDMPFREGTVSKWTNYVTGWQTRWLVLRNGTLSYYRSKREDSVCRGTVDLAIAFVTRHEFDSTRLDIQFVDQTFYLRMPSAAERDMWLEAVHQSQAMGDNGGMYRSHSVASLQSMTSLTSSGSGSIRISAFTEKLNEVKTYQTLVNNLVEKLQGVFSSMEDENKIKSQVMAEFLMLKSTTGGMLIALEECADMAQRREDEWRKKLKRANEKRAKIEAAFRELQQSKYQTGVMVGPDMQEGPHSLLTEEAWFDALDSAEEISNLENNRREPTTPTAARTSVDDNDVLTPTATTEDDPNKTKKTRYCDILAKNLNEFDASNNGVDGQTWELVSEDDGMKISRSQAIMGDATIDKNKTEAVFQRVTAYEICSYFSMPEVKTDWESQTIEALAIDRCPEVNVVVCYHGYARIWPSAPRDALICNQVLRLGNDRWCAHGRTVEHERRPVRDSSMVHIQAKCALFCTTMVKPNLTGPPTRADISTKIEYFAQINPGGWAPSNVVAAVSRREFPKTLRNLEKHSVKHYKDKPIDFGEGSELAC